MRTRALLPVLGLGLGLAVLAATAAPIEKTDKPDADKIAKLVAQLGSDSFDDREKASADLEAIGDPAYDALRQALKNPDEEIHKRAEIIVGRIEKRRESIEALKPKHVHLIYKDTPLTEALEDFNKKSGCSLVLGDPDGKLKDRKITLDTGDVTFWQALDQFCDKAGLQENVETSSGLTPPIGVPVVRPGVKLPLPIQAPNPVPLPPPVKDNAAAPAPAVRQTGVAVLAAPPPAQQPANPPAAAPPPANAPPFALQPGVVVGGPAPGSVIGGPGGANSISLVDGKADALPTDASTAVRVQALPKADAFGPAPDGEVLLALRLSIEPRMLLQSVEKVKIAKAVDDQKQELTQTATDGGPAGALPGGAAPAPGGGFGGPVILPFPGPAVGIAAGGIQQEVAVHLKKGEKAAKSLTELSGVISAHILGEAIPVITADEVLKAAGKTFKGGENGQLTIVDAAKNPNGVVVIRLQLQPPTDSVPAGGGANPIGVGPAVPIKPLPPVRLAPAPAANPPGAAAAPPAAGGVAVGGVAIVVGPGGWNAPGAAGVTLLDDKGNAVKQIGSQMQNQVTVINNVATVTQMFVLTFQLDKDQEPAKLVYNGRKILSVDVPFTLKDVPLP